MGFQTRRPIRVGPGRLRFLPFFFMRASRFAHSRLGFALFVLKNLLKSFFQRRLTPFIWRRFAFSGDMGYDQNGNDDADQTKIYFCARHFRNAGNQQYQTLDCKSAYQHEEKHLQSQDMYYNLDNDQNDADDYQFWHFNLLSSKPLTLLSRETRTFPANGEQGGISLCALLPPYSPL